MKNNIKKASVKVLGRSVVFSAFYADFCLCPESVMITTLSPSSHPRQLVGKRTTQKDTIIEITGDSQVNSNFPYRWSPFSVTFNNYFYLSLYLYITRITINNNTPHPKSLKNQNRRVALGRPATKLLGSSVDLAQAC